MTIASILSSKGDDVATVAVGTSLRDAVAELARRRIGALPVTDGDSVVGILSERDLVYRIAEHGPEVLDWPAERLMSSPAITVEPSTPVLNALSLMTRRRIRHLPVTESGRLTGIVSIGDLVKYRIEQIEAEAEAMLTYIQQA